MHHTKCELIIKTFMMHIILWYIKYSHTAHHILHTSRSSHISYSCPLLGHVDMLISAVSTLIAAACASLRVHILGHNLVSGAGVDIKILLYLASIVMSSNNIRRKD